MDPAGVKVEVVYPNKGVGGRLRHPSYKGLWNDFIKNRRLLRL